MNVTFCGHAQLARAEEVRPWLCTVTRRLIEQGGACRNVKARPHPACKRGLLLQRPLFLCMPVSPGGAFGRLHKNRRCISAFCPAEKVPRTGRSAL